MLPISDVAEEEEEEAASPGAPGAPQNPGKRKRGKSAGGTKAHYGTIVTPEARVAEYSAHPFEVRGEVLWCNACGKGVSHKTKSGIDTHLQDTRGFRDPGHISNPGGNPTPLVTSRGHPENRVDGE